MMSRYASHTSVSTEHSRAEIERIVSRYGADQFVSGWRADGAIVGFRMRHRMIRFTVPTPAPSDKAFTQTKTGRERAPEQARLAWEQASRQRWRALALAIKAKLEAVESGIVTFEQEFGMHIILPNGQTVFQQIAPEIERAYASGKVPPLMLTSY